jgi:hypothetical protein
MTRTIAPAHHELRIAELDAIAGGGQTSAALPQVPAGKSGTQPNLLVVIAIIAILIG